MTNIDPLASSNQLFWDWEDILPSGSMTAWAVDRLEHHCHIIGIQGSRDPGERPT